MHNKKIYSSLRSEERIFKILMYLFLAPQGRIKFFVMHISSRHFLAGGLVFFGCAVIALGVLQVGAYLKEPYADKEQEISSRELSSQILASRQVQDLHLLDSDKDGLSDFDELNVYKTSPYLADTDSDGISDKVEIDAFEDP